MNVLLLIEKMVVVTIVSIAAIVGSVSEKLSPSSMGHKGAIDETDFDSTLGYNPTCQC